MSRRPAVLAFALAAAASALPADVRPACSASWGTFGAGPLTRVQRNPNPRPWKTFPGEEGQAFEHGTEYEGLAIVGTHFAFCMIEKVACTQFGRILGQATPFLPHRIHTLTQYKANPDNKRRQRTYELVFNEPRATRAVFVRDPLSRFASAIIDKCYDPQFTNGFCFFRKGNGTNVNHTPGHGPKSLHASHKSHGATDKPHGTVADMKAESETRADTMRAATMRAATMKAAAARAAGHTWAAAPQKGNRRRLQGHHHSCPTCAAEDFASDTRPGDNASFVLKPSKGPVRFKSAVEWMLNVDPTKINGHYRLQSRHCELYRRLEEYSIIGHTLTLDPHPPSSPSSVRAPSP